MLDLAQPLGEIEGLMLYGDHARADLVYYLPDEIDVLSSAGAADIALQVFFEDAALVGDQADLSESVGAILGLGVRCGVSAGRLDEVRRQLISRLARDDLMLAQPPWERGTVDLLLLDTQATGSDTTAADRDDPLVRGVIGSRAPSLADGELAALFHARLDRRGTALMAAALEGGIGSLAGVLYDLDFNGMSPAVDLRMRADLDRCADAFTVGGGVTVYYVSADVQATFAELQETGVIEIDLVTEVADPETQKLVDEAVQDFHDTLMRELFRPSVAPMQELLGAGAGLPSAPSAPVRFRFAYTRTQSSRFIEVDYRKRMARRRRHNPQAHLASLRAGLDSEQVIQRVPLSTAWREFRVEAALPGGFADPGLRGVSVVLWRGGDPVLEPEEARGGGLRMPAGVANLARFDFSQADSEPRIIQFVTQPDEPPFYRWQAKLTYAPEDQVDSPLEIWSEPRTSTSSDLDIFPEVLTASRRVQLNLGAGHGDDLEAIHAEITVRRSDGMEEAARTLRVTPAEPETVWRVRRPESLRLTAEATLQLLYRDGRKLLLPVRRVVESELFANTPLRGRVPLSALVDGATPDVLMVMVEAVYQDVQSGYRDQRRLRLLPPNFAQPTVEIPVLRLGDRVSWLASAILATGENERIGQGETLGDTLVLNLATGRRVRVQWLGGPLEDEGIRFVRVTIRARDEAGVTQAEELVEWRSGEAVAEREVQLPRGLRLQSRVERRFDDGSRDNGDFQTLIGDLVAVSP